MTERRDDLLDETILRRALRFEADEPRPRFDPEALAVAARDQRPDTRTVAIGLTAAGLTGVIAGAVWSLIFGLAPAFENDALSAALDAVVVVATLLVPIAQAASQPVVPLSLIAALGVAIIHELRERREHAHANAS